MAITINGSGTITGVNVGGLPDGIVDTDMLADSAVSTAKLPTGTILQVKQTAKTDFASQAFTTTNTYQDISGMSVSITPVAADSNILIMFTAYITQSGTATMHVRLARGSSDDIFIGNQGPAGSSQLRDTAMFRPAVSPYSLDQGNVSNTYLDDPTYTLGDSLTYKLRWTLGSTYSATAYLNRGSSGTNADYDPTVASHITVMEIAG